jgi:hypothetical protein
MKEDELMTTKPRTQAVITIAMDNDAFAHSPATELSRILVKLAGEIATDGIYYTALCDSNGTLSVISASIQTWRTRRLCPSHTS